MGNNKRTLVVPMIIVAAMFAVLGFAVGVNAFFIPFVQDAFNISKTMSYLVMTATFSSFVVFGVPSGMIIKKIGYKGGMVVAFLFMAVGFGLVAPAASLISFPLFLMALFINGMGQTILNTAVNPYITILGPEEGAAARISIMGICNKLSFAGASLLLAVFMDLVNVDIADTIIPFYGIAGILVVMGILSYFAPLPEVKAAGEDDGDTTSGASAYANSKTSILQFPHLLLGGISLFFYVGVEVIALGTINDFAKYLELPSPENYVWFTSAAMVIGYMSGVLLIPKVLSQSLALKICAVLGIITTLAVVFVPVGISIYVVAVLGLANSLMWPAIWPLAIADLGKFTKTGSSLLVMGIVGGAVLPLIFGYLADITSHQMGYWICFPAYLFILYFAVSGHKVRTVTVTA
ncbi:N-acetyl glucosamine transporter, NagP [hydrothermal vent metagenome]|uniref:N-acetyl glucosamine transporter, NagP n=1 Tax=hydrothermal vent metagenome TaxID=652676 RepID=A0A3B0U6A4_9ZZZZ